ncbi:3-ketoacyl-mitochondrial [Nannochloropsis oceanica]
MAASAFAARKGLFIVGAKRTPFGAFGGKLKSFSATELAYLASKGALLQAKIDPKHVDVVYAGNVIQSSNDACYLSRHVGLKAGVPQHVPALTINRLCGSGFETVAMGCEAMELGQASVALAAGTENMSAAPFVVDGNSVRWGTPLGKGPEMKDSLWSGLTDSLAGTPMGITAENLGTKYGITRGECDEYGVRSQQLWAKAKEGGKFDAEVVPVEVKTKKGIELFTTDEHPRPQVDLAKISKLSPVFKKEGLVTAANASGIADGAGALVLATEEVIKAHGLIPLARIVSWARVGCDPSIMGIGPVEAIKGALSVAGLTLNDLDRVEINEAFAAQFLACRKELGLDMAKTNVHGGAIALGHPLAASGSRILASLANELKEGGGKGYAMGSACIGGGQGIAVLLQGV